MIGLAENVRLQGIGASPGILIGTAYVFGRANTIVNPRPIEENEIDSEIERFEIALEQTKKQISDLQQQISTKLPESQLQIFESHLMLVDDPTLKSQVLERVNAEKINIEFAFKQVVKEFTTPMMAVDDPFFKDRITDINDVAERIIRNLSGIKDERLENLPGKRIVVSEQITPSDTIHMDRQNVIGFITEDGSKTSHAAIMANSLSIPAIVGMHKALQSINSGDTIILNGETGEVIIKPDEETLSHYRELLKQEEKVRLDLEKRLHLPCETLDGFRIELAANIEHPSDVDKLIEKYPGTGVGLFRTEYLFMDSDNVPSEEEQFDAYKYVAEKLNPNSVIIRTADLGGDKFASAINKVERNPFLGVRGIRLSLGQSELFRKQLRAILRASHYGKIKIMFPLVSSVEEISDSLNILNECKAELREQAVPFDSTLEVGMMMEVPSAAIIADRMLKYVDFFSIGTNDLVQYLIAVDRVNENLAHLYQPTHPSIIRMIRYIVRAARAKGKWVGLCGEVGSDTTLTPLLLGLGLQELSMSPQSIPLVKDTIRSLKMHEAERLANRSLDCDSGPEVLELCKELISRIKGK